MITASDVYEKIANDKEIIDIYRQIDEMEESNKDAWCHHNFAHVSNVKDIVERLLQKLDYGEEIVEEAKIAAILHDVGALKGKPGHAERSYIFAKKYFVDNNINLVHADQVLEAIRYHSEGFNTNNIIQLALILADKMDIKKTRPTKNGLEIPGNRQFGNIEQINIDIQNNSLVVRFESNDKLDKKELEDYYFTKKVGNAIKSFSTKLDLKYRIYLNNSEWNEIL